MATQSPEVHLSNVRQLTFEGENAEAYFSFDGTRLIFQSTPRSGGCDQIYTMSLDGSDVQMLSTGQGRATCSYYYPTGDKILYSSTHHCATACPAVPYFSQGYVWAVYPSFDIFMADADGSNLSQLTTTFGYDAEATFSPPDGSKIVYRAHRPTGASEVEDYMSLLALGLIRPSTLEIFVMNADGSDQTEITHNGGANFGPFWHPSGGQDHFCVQHG